MYSSRKGEVNLSNYKNLIMAALTESANHKLLGSLGDEEAQKLYLMLKYEDYCVRNSIDYDEMTDYDFECAYEEEMEKAEKDSFLDDNFYYDDYEYDPFDDDLR